MPGPAIVRQVEPSEPPRESEQNQTDFGAKTEMTPLLKSLTLIPDDGVLPLNFVLSSLLSPMLPSYRYTVT